VLAVWRHGRRTIDQDHTSSAHCHSNCFLRTQWPLGTRLSGPECWVEDAGHSGVARVPADLVVATKPELALGLVNHAVASGVAHVAVTAETGYGAVPVVLEGLEQRQESYVVQVSKACAVRPKRAESLG